MKKIVMLLLLSTGFAVSSVHAQTAEEMVSRCRNMVNARVVDDKVQIPRDFDSGVCWGAFLSYEEAITYVGHEYLDGTRSQIHRQFFGVCPPSEFTITQLIKVFVEYAKSHPEQYQKDYFQVALNAGRQAFPCLVKK